MDRNPPRARDVDRSRDRYKCKNHVITLKRIGQLVSQFIVVSNLHSVLIVKRHFRSIRSRWIPPSGPNRVSFQCQNDRWHREIIEAKRHKANNDMVTVRSSSETLCALLYFLRVKSLSENVRRDRSDQNIPSDRHNMLNKWQHKRN